MEAKLREAVDALRDDLLRSLGESVRIPSVGGAAEEGAPYGVEVRRCLDHALETARGLGLSVTDMDHQVGWCEYGEGAELVAVLGHLDVVPAGDGWDGGPFSGEVRDGRIYGRGTMDDKGPTMAAVYALAALKASGLPLGRRVRVLFGTNEETGSQDMVYYKTHGGELPVMGFTPDGEYPLINGEKGLVDDTYRCGYRQSGPMRITSLRGGTAVNVVPAQAVAELACPPELVKAWASKSTRDVACTAIDRGLRVEVRGVGAHGSTPEQGRNAIGLLARFLSAMPLEGGAAQAVQFLAEKIGLETGGESLGAALTDDISGRLTLNLGVLRGDGNGMEVELNYRYPVTRSLEECGPAVRSAFENAGFRLVERDHKESLYVPEDSPLVRTLLQVYADETGLPAVPKSIGGGTYAKSIPNIVAFGPIFPGDEVREHKPNEFMEIDRLMENTRIIAEAMYRLGNQ